jgi:hypothetical protein
MAVNSPVKAGWESRQGGYFRVGIAPLPASAVMVGSSPKTFTSPSGGSFHTEVLPEPMRFRHPEGLLHPMFWDLT